MCWKILKVVFWFFFYIPTIDSNGVFSMTIISIIISSIVIMMLKSLSYWAGCQQVS